jgi:hypothetical protein
VFELDVVGAEERRRRRRQTERYSLAGRPAWTTGSMACMTSERRASAAVAVAVAISGERRRRRRVRDEEDEEGRELVGEFFPSGEGNGCGGEAMKREKDRQLRLPSDYLSLFFSSPLPSSACVHRRSLALPDSPLK